jgi:hypothetical protein
MFREPPPPKSVGWPVGAREYGPSPDLHVPNGPNGCLDLSLQPSKLCAKRLRVAHQRKVGEQSRVLGSPARRVVTQPQCAALPTDAMGVKQEPHALIGTIGRQSWSGCLSFQQFVACCLIASFYFASSAGHSSSRLISVIRQASSWCPLIAYLRTYVPRYPSSA